MKATDPRYQRFLDQIQAYIDGVLSGEIPTGRLQRLAVERHLWDMELGEARGLVFDVDKAATACAFFPLCLSHSKGEWHGKPFELTDVEAFLVGMVFGWRRAESGLRRFTRAHIEVARKFGKSEVGSGVALKMATFDDPLEPGAEVYLAATKEDQVRDTTFRQCSRMVAKSPFLRARIDRRIKALLVNETDDLQPGSVIKPIGSDSATSDGYDLHGGVLEIESEPGGGTTARAVFPPERVIDRPIAAE